MDKKNYPLIVSKEIEKLVKTFRELTLVNSNHIEKVDSNFLVYLQDIENPNFFFTITDPNQDKDLNPIFLLHYTPYNGKNLNSRKIHVTLPAAIKCFDEWIGILHDYNKINFSEEDEFTKQYEEEFYSEFEILDDDADNAPFENDRQILLYNFLTNLAEDLRNRNSDNPTLLAILSDTEDLRDNIQNLTKRNFVRKMSNLFGRLKKISLKLVIDIFDVGKKEIIKQALYSGLDVVKNLYP